jgi:hypothetical protein
MTTRERINTGLIRAIVDVYSMTEGDINALVEQIKSQLMTTYRQSIQRQLVLYSCQKIVTGPDNQALAFLEAKALKDARGIANTYQNDLERKVQFLYIQNRRGNRNYYSSNLNTWARQRTTSKARVISLNTMTSAREYAVQRFRTENNITGKFIFAGPPPVCKKCIRLKAKGLVSAEQAKNFGDSQHINCPHFWQAVTLGKFNCNDETWTG